MDNGLDKKFGKGENILNSNVVRNVSLKDDVTSCRSRSSHEGNRGDEDVNNNNNNKNMLVFHCQSGSVRPASELQHEDI